MNPASVIQMPRRGGPTVEQSDRWKQTRDREAEDFGAWLACETEISALDPVIDRIEAHLVWLKERRGELVRERDAATARMDRKQAA